jgi:hypothetical protein
MFLNTGGRMYSLSGAGSLTIEADTTWVQRLFYYSISHNVCTWQTRPWERVTVKTAIHLLDAIS